MKKFFRSALTLITAVSAIFYFASCFTPYISPVTFWPMAFLALAYPYLAAVIILLLLIWIFVKKKFAIFLLILLFIGFQNLTATFAVGKTSNDFTKDSTTLRILTWNVQGFNNPYTGADTPMSNRRQMLTYIKNSKADILCLQEFIEHSAPNFRSNTKDLVDLGYKYIYRTDELFHYFDYGTYLSGSAIFSKIPFTKSGKTLLGDSSYPEHIAFIDVSFKNKPLRVFTTHFKSLNLFAGPNDTSSRVLFHNDTRYVYNISKFEKLKVFAQEHAAEAFIAKAELNKSPLPIIFTGDMNSVPASYPYYIMSRGLQDVFLKKSIGLGLTLVDMPETLRIDFLLTDKKFQAKNYQKDRLYLSDHFPQLMDVSWKE